MAESSGNIGETSSPVLLKVLVGSDNLGGGRLSGGLGVFFEGHRSSSRELDVVFFGAVGSLEEAESKL